MKYTHFLIILGLGMCLFSSPVEAGEYTAKDRSMTNRQKHQTLFGYYPYYFSEGFRGRYSYTAEEKGHYILGRTDRDRPLPQLSNEIKLFVPEDLPEIYMSTTMSSKEIVLPPIMSGKDVVERVDDSKDLDRVIREHKEDRSKLERSIVLKKWRFQSEEMKKLLER